MKGFLGSLFYNLCYTYTNMAENYTELPDDEFNRQESVLKQIRYKHALELVSLGIVDRAIASTAQSNTFNWRNKRPLGEPTDFQVLRNAYNLVSAHEALLLTQDLQLAPEGQVNIEFAIGALNNALMDPKSPAQVLKIRKSDPGQFGRDTDEFTLGLAIASETAKRYGIDTLMPVPGLDRDDLVIVDRQLSELATARQMHGLTIINESTLHESHERGAYHFRRN
jgi:hypothetical protein